MVTDIDISLFVAFLLCSGVAGIVDGFASVMLQRLPHTSTTPKPSHWPLTALMGAILIVFTILGLVIFDRIGGVDANFYLIGFVSVIGLCMAGGLYGFISRTRVGFALRAMTQNPQAAALMGVNVLQVARYTRTVSFGLIAISGLIFAVPLWHMDSFPIWQTCGVFAVCHLLSRQSFFKLYGPVQGQG